MSSPSTPGAIVGNDNATAKMTADIAYRSVRATYRAGGHGVVLAPNYTSMHLAHLDGVGQALAELGLK